MFPAAQRARRRRPGVVVAALVGLSLVAGCSLTGSSEPQAGPSSAAAPDDRAQYVAMGDSYTAAPLQPLEDDEIIDSCLRSKENYPTLVAHRLDYHLTDVSCSGASTTQIFSQQRFTEGTEPPQLEALSEDTELVTIGIGANDFSFFSKMIFDCLQVAPSDVEGAPCQAANRTSAGQDRLERNLSHIKRNVARAMRGIGKRAPNARVLLIGYPQLLPPDDLCRAKLPLAKGDYPYVRRLNLRLAHEVRKGGVAGGAEYVDLLRASTGHDICSDSPWIAGIRGRPRHAMGLHPYPREQEAVSELVLAQVEKGSDDERSAGSGKAGDRGDRKSARDTS